MRVVATIDIKRAPHNAIENVFSELSKYRQWIGEFSMSMRYDIAFDIPFTGYKSDEKAREFYSWAKNNQKLFTSIDLYV
jgi:hypothetical protein